MTATPKPQGTIRQELRAVWRILVVTIALLWLVELFDSFVIPLEHFGIRPRSATGLVGILTSPFLHSGFGHLFSNTIGLVILGALVLMWGRREFFAASIASIIVGGAGVWLVGASNTNHIGASGIVFGFFGYLLARGFFERRIGSMVLSTLVAVCFGGMLSGIVPGLAGAGISWEAHLFGAIGGILVARRWRKTRTNQ